MRAALTVKLVAVFGLALVGCTTERRTPLAADTVPRALESDARSAARGWGDDELFGFMNAAFTELSGQGLEVARRGRSPSMRKLGREMNTEFRVLATRSDSLARERRIIPAHGVEIDSLLRSTDRAAPRGAERSARDRDAQLLAHAEHTLQSTLIVLNEARTVERAADTNLFTDAARSALWRTLDHVRMLYSTVDRNSPR